LLDRFLVRQNEIFFCSCENVQSLCGHTSPVESVAFDSAEVLVLAGASNGAIKLWDLEEIKSKSLPLLVSHCLIKIGVVRLKNVVHCSGTM
jgi:WD40 repeat protein